MLQDVRVFDTQEFVPDRELVVAREGELTGLSHDIEVWLRDRAGGLAIVDGPPGAGKTMVARYLLTDLEREYRDVATAYVNCWDTHSEFGVLASLLEAAGDPVRIDQRGSALYRLRERLAEATTTRPLVAVLDEATQLDTLEAIWGLYERENVYILLITNDRDDLLRPASGAEASRLRSGNQTHLPAYSVDHLVTILERRANAGLTADAVSESVLRTIAQRTEGDARRAIESLRQAAQAARDEGMPSISEAIVEAAVADAREEIRQRNVSNLKPKQRFLVEILAEKNEWQSMGVIHERFCKRHDDVTRQTLRRHLRKLAHYNHVEMKGNKRGRRYRAVE